MIRSLFEKRSESLTLDNPKLAEIFGFDIGGLGVGGYNSLKEATVYICTKIRAESVGKLPLKLYNNKMEAREHELFYLLKTRPNEYMSSINFWKCIEAQRTLKGNAYAYILRDKKGKVEALIPIESDKVKVVIDDVGLLNKQNRLWYVVDDGKKPMKLFPDEILHFIGDITLDGMVGIPPIEYLKKPVQNGKATQEFINKFFKNGLTTRGIIQYVGDLDEPSKKRFRDEFENMSSGLSNAHRISMLPIGYQFQPISLNMADAQFLENAKLSYRQIAAAFGIKSHHINDLERATYANIAEQQNDFYISTLQPMLECYEQELNYKLLAEVEMYKGLYFKFNVDSMLRTNIKDRYEAYRVGIQGSFLLPNEVRAKEELEPLNGGDVLLCNGAMMPLHNAGEQYSKGGEKSGKKEGNKGNKK